MEPGLVPALERVRASVLVLVLERVPVRVLVLA